MLNKLCTKVKQKIFIRRSKKKHGRTSPDVQFKKFSMNKQKQDLERTISELGKPFLKNKIQKIEKTETPK